MNRNVVLWTTIDGPSRTGKIVGVSKRCEYLPATEERRERVVRYPETWYQGGVYVRFYDSGGTTFAANATYGKWWRFT